jgi:hypothetical protein
VKCHATVSHPVIQVLCNSQVIKQSSKSGHPNNLNFITLGYTQFFTYELITVRAYRNFGESRRHSWRSIIESIFTPSKASNWHTYERNPSGFYHATYHAIAATCSDSLTGHNKLYVGTCHGLRMNYPFPCHSPHETWNYSARVQHESNCSYRDIYRCFMKVPRYSSYSLCSLWRCTQITDANYLHCAKAISSSLSDLRQLYDLLFPFTNATTQSVISLALQLEVCDGWITNFVSDDRVYSQRDDYTFSANVNYLILWNAPNIFWLCYKHYTLLP